MSYRQRYRQTEFEEWLGFRYVGYLLGSMVLSFWVCLPLFIGMNYTICEVLILLGLLTGMYFFALGIEYLLFRLWNYVKEWKTFYPPAKEK